ncbi:unnamed protein product [Enterobius vermicularis]|uniref:Vacuolar protein sorting-associated protein 18 homolog n=1 Tax=Enterobius vermicularis TaxID=51028 RepID=A0A0N4UTB1_ENTVE|nr:unnamed protein product [Enterobius vermicularis]
MISHADFDSQLFLARKLKDVKTTLDIYFLQMKYEEALEIIALQSNPEYFYKYSPILIEHVPIELVNLWIEREKYLSPEKLLPALYRCQQNPKMVAAAFQYLKKIIQGSNASKPVHNFMITLLSRYKTEELLTYLTGFGYDKSKVPYDVEYALRICLEKEELKQCSVFLYCIDGLYDEAVSLALTIDVDLAKECAKRMKDDRDDSIYEFFEQKQDLALEARRNVWLKIARHIIEVQKDVVACIDLLKESDDALKIQDVLPFFPDFASIRHFKEPLCKCLREHSGKIKVIQRQMKEATETAQQVRMMSEKLKKKLVPFVIVHLCKRLVIIRGSDHCSLCDSLVMDRPFYAFNCKHFFHRDCIEKESIASFSKEETSEYRILRDKEKLLQKMLDDAGKGMSQPLKKQREIREDLAKIRLKLSDMITGECLLCGVAMIKSVGTAFYSAEEYSDELSRW